MRSRAQWKKQTRFKSKGFVSPDNLLAVPEQGFPLDQPGDAEGEQHDALQDQDQVALVQLVLAHKEIERREREKGEQDDRPAGDVDAVAYFFVLRLRFAPLPAQREKEHGVHGQQREEYSGAGNMDHAGNLGIHLEEADGDGKALGKFQREEGDADAGDAAQRRDDDILGLVALVGDQEHGDGDHQPDEEIAHVGVVVIADRTLAGQIGKDQPAQHANERQQYAQDADQAAQVDIGHDDALVLISEHVCLQMLVPCL